MKNKKGFTLIEVLLIILLIGMLVTTAFSSFFDTSETFTFLSEYKPIISDIRKARSYAINNKNSDTYERHGIYIEANDIWLFGDLNTPFMWDGELNEQILEHLSFNEDYEIVLLSNFGGAGLPVELYYDNGSGELTSYADSGGQVLLQKDQYKRLDFMFEYADNDLQKFFYIFQVSGIVEESKDAL